MPLSAAPAARTEAPWSLDADDLAESLDASAATGLTATEAARRLEQHGPNRLAEPPRRPAWKRLLAQFTDLLILILIGAAVVSFVISRELKTPIVVLVVVVLNAVIGFVQEGKAEKSLQALEQMMVRTARVRRDGRVLEIPATEVVPGDLAMVEAGDRIPADGRLVLATNLEIEEAALTGESQPTPKSTDRIDRPVVPIGDRGNCVFMNTTVTRGRGELLVTDTGMRTEVGRIADLLSRTETEETPLQRQLHGLATSLAKLAALVVAAVVVIGVLRGQPAAELFNTAVALAVASIPEGLPAVTAVTLAIGTQRMARKHAIVKRLAAVETLGCTSVICSDKTGTLTLNRMTAREIVIGGNRHPVTGEGYGTEGTIEGLDDPKSVRQILLPIALCNDASVTDGTLVGDPTEGALVVLAAKGGVDVHQARLDHPRLAELPFDSATKFMVTVHELDGSLVLLAKGAPDVLLGRSNSALDEHGNRIPIAQVRERLLAENERLAARGLRVLAVADRPITPEEFANDQVGEGLDDLVEDLTLLALIGIVDPPRPEAQAAIAEAHAAGISVRMITGDHAATAAAIGGELGLHGGAVTGAELDQMDDEELQRRLDDITVFARVAPEHKLRLVTALRDRGEVVAMTGDGVNDAPALKRSDIGVAMGITGTEVTKEAATMVLTDDNFATIVGAVEQGRTIYGNIVHFVRFQLTTTLGFAMLFLFASALGIAGGKPFTAIAILWVNLIMDGPPAMALGVDPPEGDVMARRPRPLSERILTRGRWWAIGQAAVIMAVGSLAVLEWAPGDTATAGTATVGGTMAFTTFVLFQFFNILNSRSDHASVFTRRTLTNRWLWVALVAVLLLQVAVVHLGPLQRLFDTTSLTVTQWLVAVAVASTVLWAEELRKLFIRRNQEVIE
jgi:Ca2+-transporting ATPase